MWIRAKVPVSNKDIFSDGTTALPTALTNPNGESVLLDAKYIDTNMIISPTDELTHPQVWYITGGAAVATQISDTDLQFEYEEGKEINSWYQ